MKNYGNSDALASCLFDGEFIIVKHGKHRHGKKSRLRRSLSPNVSLIVNLDKIFRSPTSAISYLLHSNTTRREAKKTVVALQPKSRRKTTTQREKSYKRSSCLVKDVVFITISFVHFSRIISTQSFYRMSGAKSGAATKTASSSTQPKDATRRGQANGQMVQNVLLI